MNLKDTILLVSIIANVMLAIFFFSSASSLDEYRVELKKSRNVIDNAKRLTYAIKDSLNTSEQRYVLAVDSMKNLLIKARDNSRIEKIKSDYEKIYAAADSSSFNERMRFFANELSE